MNLAQVEAFLVLSEELHFGRTATRLYLSQPRVSRLVASLEREVGGTLFERTSRRVSLTPLGVQLQGGLASAYSTLIEAFDEAQATARGTRGQLCIGFTASSDGPSISHMVAKFDALQPDCDIALIEVPIYDPYRSLREGRIDVLVNWLAVDEADLSAGPPIEYRDRLLIVSRTHRWATRASVSLEELGDEEVALLPPSFPGALYDALVPPCTPGGRTIRRTKLCHTLHEIISEVARGRLVHPTVASLPLLARDDIVLLPIIDLAPLPLGLIWCAARDNGRVRALVRAARTVAEEG